MMDNSPKAPRVSAPFCVEERQGQSSALSHRFKQGQQRADNQLMAPLMLIIEGCQIRILWYCLTHTIARAVCCPAGEICAHRGRGILGDERNEQS